ncbi:MAG: class I SAM-dependent methyltransferase [Lautropia sp.]|nr:class I SAM-dependent methyltransferase [Lautropia sp.]
MRNGSVPAEEGLSTERPQADWASIRKTVGNEPTERGVVLTYDRFAPLYDRVFGRVLGPGRKLMAAATSALQPSSILEVGVGTGLTLAGYPAHSRVVGIDLSPDMLERARMRAAAMPERDITLHAMNAERMDFPDGSFDCVTVPYVLSVTPHPDRLVQEIRRVCRPDGSILVLNHFSGSGFWWLMERAVRSVADRVGFRSDFDYARHILSHNWQVVSVRSVNLFGLSKLVVLRNTPSASAGRQQELPPGAL